MENRMGRFFVPETLLFEQTTAVAAMMEGIIVTHCVHDFARRGMEYVGNSPGFLLNPPNCLPRNYEIEKQLNGTLCLVLQRDDTDTIANLKAELAIACAALERVRQLSDLRCVASLNGAEHWAVQAVYGLRCEYAKLRSK